MKNIVALLRPHQWIKNIFVFAPMFFSLNFTAGAFIHAVYAFVIFSMAAGAIYILNDYHDVAEDRLHPTKCQRPIASGKVSEKTALTLFFVLIFTAPALSYLISLKMTLALVIYIILNILYTYKLKHIPILDISIIAFGFVLRIFAGAYASRTPVSSWIILVTFQLALFLALAKRRDDVLLAAEGKKTRRNIDGYNAEMINAAMVFMAGVTTVSYLMYSMSADVIQRFGSNKIYLTSFFVIVGILRYMQITFVEEKSGSPTMIVYKDTFLKLILLGWLASFLVITKL